MNLSAAPDSAPRKYRATFQAGEAAASQQQEKAKGLQTLVTSGRIGFGSKASAALQSSLESRLVQRLDTAGSTLFTLT